MDFNKKIRSLVGQIQETAYEITTTTTVDVFVNYTAHINAIQVNVHHMGWHYNYSADLTLQVILKPSYQNDKVEDIIRDLCEIKVYLDDIIREIREE